MKDRMWLRFHKPSGMSYSHFRCLIRERVNFANSSVRCPVCGGNDMDMPCAYPSEDQPGCIRDERLAATM